MALLHYCTTALLHSHVLTAFAFLFHQLVITNLPMRSPSRCRGMYRFYSGAASMWPPLMVILSAVWLTLPWIVLNQEGGKPHMQRVAAITYL